MRVGSNGVGVAASPAETEALLTTLTSHVVEVTQTRLTNVYDSVEAYNAATTGATVPYHVLVLAGFPAGISDRAAELLGRLARNGPRSGLYIVATLDPGLPMPRDFDLAALTALGTTLSLDPRGDLTWDDPDFGFGVIEPDQMPGAARANPWLDAVGAAAGSASRDLPFGRIAIAPAQRWASGHHRRPGRADRRGQQGRAAALRHGGPRRAPRPGRRGCPDGQDQPAARADQPARPGVPAGGARALPARLQGGRVRRLPDRTAAARPRDHLPDRPRVRAEHAAPLPRRDRPAGPAVPRGEGHRPARLPAGDRAGAAPGAGDHG